MSSYSFSHAERYAVFTAHNERCGICEEPVSLGEVQIDHIVPEWLDDNPQLAATLDLLGLPGDFSLNSFANWMPAHPKCNRVKSGLVFKPTLLVQGKIQLAASRAARAKDIYTEYVSDRKLSVALNQILAAAESNKLTEKHKRALLPILLEFHNKNRRIEDRGEPLFIAPGLKVLRDEGGLLLIQGPGGMVGYRPNRENLDSSWDCPNCGPTAWNGTRCVSCGQMIDPD